MLTVGFDAEHDTPARMRAYGRERGIDDPDWRFASADAATSRRLADDCRIHLDRDPDRLRARRASHGRRRGRHRWCNRCTARSFAPPELVEPLKSLVLERGLDRSTVRGVLDTVRLFCTAYDPVARRYVVDYSMIAGALPALLLLAMAAAAIVVAGRRNR